MDTIAGSPNNRDEKKIIKWISIPNDLIHDNCKGMATLIYSLIIIIIIIYILHKQKSYT